MKKILSLVMLLMCGLTLSAADENKVWEGSLAISWNNDYFPGIQLDTSGQDDMKTIFAGLAKNDVVRLYTTTTYESPQYAVKYKAGTDWTWTDMTVANNAGVLSFTVESDDIATWIIERGLIVTGQGYTLVKITIEAGGSATPEPVNAGETFTAWTGEKVFPSEWSAWEQIPASAFANAQKDMLLRAKFKDVKTGAQFQISTSSWGEMPDAPLVNIDGLYQQYTITEAMLAELKTNGCIVKGISYTLTSIEVMNPADLKTLTLTVPVTGGDWVFENETPTFTIQVKNPYDETVKADAVIAITTDKMEPVTTLTKSVVVAAKGEENIVFTWTEPAPAAGFYKATCFVNDDLARAFFFGVNPTQIVSAPDKQADFATFWQNAKDELKQIEATDEPVLTKIEAKSTAKRTVYLVEFKSVSNGDGVAETVRGYYAEPNDGKKHPVIMHYQGYDSGYRPGGQGVEPWCLDGDGDALSGHYAEFILSTRGQSVNNRPAAERADGIDRDFVNTYGDWFAYNFGDKDKYYYRGAYMDCVRAIDFMASRPTSDMTNLYAEGQSQGGAFTYAAAALSGYAFKAIAPGIAFMGDFPDYFEIVNWPAYVARENQGNLNDDEMYAFLSYFDTKNLATLISKETAVIATIGVQDNVCPPHTNIAPYNNLAGGTVKEISFNPENAHQVADDWYTVYMNYFLSKYVAPQQEATEYTLNLDDFEASDGNSYDKTTHMLTTTNAWSGGQIWIGDESPYSGKYLILTTAEACKLKVFVGYVGNTDETLEETAATKNHIVKLDDTKKVQKVIIQNQEVGTVTFLGLTVTTPAPAREGDITVEAMNWFRDATYDADTYKMKTTARWGQAGWQVGDERYQAMTLVIVDFEAVAFPVTLKLEYTNDEGVSLAYSAGVAPGKTRVDLDLPQDVKTIKKVYLTYSDKGSLVLTDASVVAAANSRPLTGWTDDEETTAIRDVQRVWTEGAEAEIYDLQGQRMDGRRLMPGLYIIQGKKVIIK